MSGDDGTKPPRILQATSVAGVVVFFGLCAAYDFWRGYRHERSPLEGMVFVFLGLPVTLLIWYLVSRRSDK